MRRDARAALTVLVVLLCVPARAADSIGKESGGRLLARCEPALELVAGGATAPLAPSRHADAMSCIGFVDGFLWGHGWAAWRQHRDMYYCPPEDLSGRQAVTTLVDYLRAHPERLDAPGHVLLFAALTQAYPCRPLAEQK
jgi:hypothetical protein